MIFNAAFSLLEKIVVTVVIKCLGHVIGFLKQLCCPARQVSEDSKIRVLKRLMKAYDAMEAISKKRLDLSIVPHQELLELGVDYTDLVVWQSQGWVVHCYAHTRAGVYGADITINPAPKFGVDSFFYLTTAGKASASEILERLPQHSSLHTRMKKLFRWKKSKSCAIPDAACDQKISTHNNSIHRNQSTLAAGKAKTGGSPRKAA